MVFLPVERYESHKDEEHPQEGEELEDPVAFEAVDHVLGQHAEA
jgi:hypothetical protein